MNPKENLLVNGTRQGSWMLPAPSRALWLNARVKIDFRLLPRRDIDNRFDSRLGPGHLATLLVGHFFFPKTGELVLLVFQPKKS
jgi:hypothetical protein